MLSNTFNLREPLLRLRNDTYSSSRGASTNARAETGFKQIGSRQGLLEGARFTMMDLDKHLLCLSLKSALKFATMSSSSSSSQAMGSTTNSTPIFGSVLAVEEDEEGENMKLMGKTKMWMAESLPSERVE